MPYCKYCGTKYSSISSLTANSCPRRPDGKGHHEPYEGDEKSQYECKYCGTKYSSISSLTANSCPRRPDGKGHHEPYEGDEKSQYECKYCGTKYSSISSLTANSCPRRPDGKGHHEPSVSGGTPKRPVPEPRRHISEPSRSISNSGRTIVDTGKSVAELPGKGCGAVIGILAFIFFALKGCLSAPNQTSSLTAPGQSGGRAQQNPQDYSFNTSSTAAPQGAEVRPAIPVAESTVPLTPFQSSPAQQLYFVGGVAADDTLNVHSGPGSNKSITARLPNGYEGITIIGASVMNDTTEWVNISSKDGSGWVNKQYLNAQPAPLSSIAPMGGDQRLPTEATQTNGPGSPLDSIPLLSPENFITSVLNTDLRIMTARFRSQYEGRTVRYTGTVVRKNRKEELLVFKGGGFLTTAYDVQVSLNDAVIDA